MPVDINKPAMIIFLNEAIHRENRLRAQWIDKHRDQLATAVTLKREPTNYFEEDVRKHTMIGGMATITRDHVIAGQNRRKVPVHDTLNIPTTKNLLHGHSIIEIGAGDAKEDPRLIRPTSDLSLDPLMRPVDSRLKKILFKPRPKFGREAYVRERAKQWPEKKYYLPECTNWDYGWRINDSVLKKAEYGRRCLLNRTLNSRTGPTPDPPYYKSPESPNYVKCVQVT